MSLLVVCVDAALISLALQSARVFSTVREHTPNLF
jgi:hypothetical protein